MRRAARLSSLSASAVLIALFACRSQPAEPAPPGGAAATADPAGLATRLERLCDALEAQRVEQHVPGMALAVVKDDEVVLARGFGYADVEKGAGVEPETLFAVGSTTKAFTAALAAMLVDEGRMSWDDPVASYLPYFTPVLEDDAGAQLTIADALSHRSGFTRMSLAWAGGGLTREEVLRTAARADAWAGYRTRFLYNNVMVMAAGEAAGVASGSSWDALIRDRILAPLGMGSTTLSIVDAQRDARLAKGYVWDEEAGEHRHVPMRNLDDIAPAGSLNSNVLDMARWVRLQLGRGAFDGERLIDDARFDEMWAEQTPIGAGAAYGLGWFLQEWNGMRVVEHGGNIDGFAAQVALLPEENVGFVLLANVSATVLQQASLGIVFEHLVGGPSAAPTGGEDPAGEGEDLASYLGRYRADFGALRDTVLTVQLTDGGELALDVPGQMVYALRPPDEEGRRYFQVTNTIAISFRELEHGRPNVLVLHQGGVNLEAPREGWEYPIEIPLDELERYLGRYSVPDEDEAFEVLIKNNHLAVDLPGQLALELHPPGDDDMRTARATDDVRIGFEMEGGVAVAMLLEEEGTVLECPRMDAPAPLPTLEELHELRGSKARSAALAALGPVRAVGTARAAQSGVRGDFEGWIDGPERVATRIDFGRFGWVRSVVTPDGAVEETSFAPPEPMTASQVEQARHGHPFALIGDWRDAFTGERLVRRAQLDGREVLEVHLRDGDLPIVILDVDPETGDVLRSREALLQPTIGQIPTTTVYSDFRDVGGVRVPFGMVSSNEASGRMEIKVETLEPVAAVPADAFALP